MFTNNDKNVTENRNIYIGGSDVPTILGINKFMTPYQLARQKAGIEKSTFKGNEYTEFGNILEPQIRDYINAVNETNFYPATMIDEERMIRGNCDGMDSDYNMLLEIKTHGKNLDTKTYIPQMQLYMYVFNLIEGWLALYERPDDFDVEFDSIRLKTRVIPRDEAYIQEILTAISEFQNRIAWLKENPGASEDDFNNGYITKESKGRDDVNELAVKTIEFQPAKIEFNYEELESILDENLKKYAGLTFTEGMATECRKTIAELRKGKRALDQYRLQTKKQLTESVTEFENQCKELNKKFDEVITPLVEQNDLFEEKRKEEKREKVQDILDKVSTDFELDEKHAAELIIEDSYLTKSKTFKSIEEELTTLAEHLKVKQDKRASDEEIIKSHVELMNSKHNVGLIEATYINLLDYQGFQDVRERIEKDVEQELEQRDKDQLLAEQEAQQITERLEAMAEQNESPSQKEDETIYLEIYEVEATINRLDALEEFMSKNGIEFKIVEGEE